MKKLNVKGVFSSCLTVLLLGTGNAYAGFWQIDTMANRSAEGSNTSQFISDNSALRIFLNQVPNEVSGQSLEIGLPMPDGSLATYQIYESSIMQPGLAAKFPDIKSYVVRGIDHPGSTGRVDISPKGFRGMIFTPYGRVFIDPEQIGSTKYSSRTADSQSKSSDFQCSAYDLEANNQSDLRNFSLSRVTSNRISGSITAYRLAVSATPEYVAAVGGSLNDTMSEINTVINRVNQIYERDLGIKLFLVSGNDELIDVDGSANFDNDFGPLLLSQNQAWIDSQIGSGSYDVGHIFSTGGGGVAQLQSVCTSSKAQGVTGLPDPADLMSDIFYIDFVSHELGHQFGGNHTFNGSEGFCGFNSQRNDSTAYEPGSGSTIMAYAGICGDENLQTTSEATFHAGTIAEINAFVQNANTGGSCATILATSPANSDPTSAFAGADKTIPRGTTFSLVGSATDVDGDTLSYQWDQFDAGIVTTAATFDFDQGTNPLFRSHEPQASPERHFPSLSNQLNLTNQNGQVIPNTNRTLNFRMTARDCKSGQATDDVRVTVDANSGPFEVTSHTILTTFVGTSQQTITWNTANTQNAPVSCANVDIDLLSFSSDMSTFGVTVLESGIPNNSIATVTIGDKSASKARFRVSCSDNVFYDISSADLNITGAIALSTTGNSTALSSAAICGDSNADGAPAGTSTGGGVGGGGSGGGGAPGLWWLLLLSGVLPVRTKIKAYI